MGLMSHFNKMVGSLEKESRIPKFEERKSLKIVPDKDDKCPVCENKLEKIGQWKDCHKCGYGREVYMIVEGAPEEVLSGIKYIEDRRMVAKYLEIGPNSEFRVISSAADAQRAQKEGKGLVVINVATGSAQTKHSGTATSYADFYKIQTAKVKGDEVFNVFAVSKDPDIAEVRKGRVGTGDVAKDKEARIIAKDAMRTANLWLDKTLKPELVKAIQSVANDVAAMPVGIERAEYRSEARKSYEIVRSKVGKIANYFDDFMRGLGDFWDFQDILLKQIEKGEEMKITPADIKATTDKFKEKLLKKLNDIRV